MAIEKIGRHRTMKSETKFRWGSGHEKFTYEKDQLNRNISNT